MFKQREVRIVQKFFTTVSVDMTQVVTSLGTLGVDSAGLLAASQSIANLGDMFRLFRVNGIKFKWVYSNGNAATQVQCPPSLLYLLPFGAAAPSGIVSLESDRGVGDLAEPFVWLSSAPSIMMPGSSATLKLKNSDLVVIDSASPAGWLATGLDATQGHFGTLYWVKAFAGASTGAIAPYYTLQIEVDISFRDLVDPTLISRQKSEVVAAKPACQVTRTLVDIHPSGCRCSTCQT